MLRRPEDIATMTIASALAFAFKNFGQYAEELGLDEDERRIAFHHLDMLFDSAGKAAFKVAERNLADEVMAYVKERGTDGSE